MSPPRAGWFAPPRASLMGLLWAYQESLAAVARMLEHRRRGPATGDLRRVHAPLREMWAESQIGHRVQTWPRGYAGDFETIELLLGGLERFDPDDPGAAMDRAVLTSPIWREGG